MSRPVNELTTSRLEEFVEKLQEQGVEYVRFELPDLHGTARSKLLPIKHVASFGRKGLNMYGGTLSLDTASNVVPGTLYHEEVKYRDQRLIPDLDSVAPVPWLSNVAKVICDAEWDSGQPLKAAPRYVLKQLLKKADELGYEVMMGHEFEFYILDPETLKPTFDGVHIFNNTRNQYLPVVDELIKNLQLAGIDIITHNCEYGPSQFEINYAPAKGIKGGDNGFTFKNAVKEIVHRAGYLATFMSKPFPNYSGCGCHFHVSLIDKRTGENAFLDETDPNGLSQVAKSFIQGQMDHARAMMALIAPTPNCYHRVKPHTFAPSNISWGIEDRTAMIRVKASFDQSTHIENRLPSGLSNPYLTAAATIAAGLLGIIDRSELKYPEKNIPSEDNPDLPKVPQSLEESLDALETDTKFCSMLGEEFVQVYTKVKKFELLRFRSHITDWEREEYMKVY